MRYPYNTIFSRGLLNSFEAALHLAYLCLEVPALLGVISVHDSQKDARNIEQDFALGHRNINFLREADSGGQLDTSAPKDEVDIMGKHQLRLNVTRRESPWTRGCQRKQC
jgi:hypothetical protein